MRLDDCFLLLFELRSSSQNGLAHGFKGAGLRILCGELPELLKRIDLLQRSLADKKQLVPLAVEFVRLVLSEHQPTQSLVFAIKQRQRDHFIHRHDA